MPRQNLENLIRNDMDEFIRAYHPEVERAEDNTITINWETFIENWEELKPKKKKKKKVKVFGIVNFCNKYYKKEKKCASK
jgi:hypothetical protein